MSRLEKHCELYHKWRKEAEQVCEHMNEAEKHAWAMFNVKHHPIAKRSFKVSWKLVAQIVAGLLLLLLGHYLHAQTITPTVTKSQIIAPLDVSGNVKVNCFVGCSATVPASFGAAFPVTGTAIGVQSGGNMVSLLADGSSNLFVNCAVGCAGGTSTPADAFANPTTAGLAMDFPMLWNGATWDRLYGDKTNGAFVNIKNSVAISSTQGTSPWVVSASGNFGVTQQTSPWVSSITTWATGTLGAMANYGTSPGSVLVPGMNAFITNVPHTICDSGCAGGSLSNNNAAPTNNNTGVLPAIANAAQPSWTEGDQVLQSTDLHGNQRATPGASLGSLTPITSVNGTLNATFSIVTGTAVPAVLVQLDQTTTITAGAIRFQVSYDGTNYVNISSDAVIDPTSATQATISMPYTEQASTNKSFFILMKGAQALQILQSTALTGTGAVTPYYSLVPSSIVSQSSGTASTNLAQIVGVTAVTAGQNGTLAVGGKNAKNVAVSTDTNPFLIAGADNGWVAGGLGLGSSASSKQIARIDPFGNLYSINPFIGPKATIVQKLSAVSSGSVASLAKAIAIPATGDSLIVVWASGSSSAAITIADTSGACTGSVYGWISLSSYVSAATPNVGAFYCPMIGADIADTITLSSNPSTSLAFEVYEISGPVMFASAAQDTLTGTSITSDTTLLPSGNDIAIGLVAVGTAAQTITFTTSGYGNDSGQQNVGGTPAGLFSFASASQVFSGSATSTTTLNATVGGSEPLNEFLVTFRTIGGSPVNATLAAETTKVIGTVNQGTSPWVENATLQAGSAVIGHVIADASSSVIGKVGIDQTTPGTTNAVEVTASTDANIGLASTSKAAVTTSVSVKTSAGNVYGVFFLNGAVAGCWLELINSASAGTLGTAVITNIPMASAGSQLLPFNPPIGGFTSGIAVGSASAIGGASACGTAATGVTILYK